MLKPQRHHGMDWLRVGAFGLLIFYHIGMYFVPWDWHVKTPRPLEWARIPMLASSAWRLPLLFAVSGFASAALFAKIGGRRLAFLRSRTARLLVPTIFAMAVIIPPQPWVELQFKHGYSGSYIHFWLADYFRFREISGIAVPTWQHLWFVVYLWVYTLWLGLLLLLLPASSRDALCKGIERVLAGPLILLTPFALLALKVFVLAPGAEETHGLFDDGATHLVYFPIFLFGWLLAGSDILWSAIRRWWKVAAVLSVAGFLPIVWIMLTHSYADDWSEATTRLFTVARIIQGWSAIVALIGVADRFWNRDHRLRPMLTEAVFPFYIIHQTIIVVTGWYLLGTGVGPGLTFLILVVTTAGGCWMFYDIGRRFRLLRPLIGLKAAVAPPADAAKGGAAQP